MQNKVQIKNIFWSDDNKDLLRNGIQKMKISNDHPLIRQIYEYDRIDHSTLIDFKVGIIKKYEKEWLEFPYETGIQLYRRENDEKMVRMVKGSKPKDSFFHLSKQSQGDQGDQDMLIIAKSPRETMLLHQIIGDRARVIGLTTGEISTLSQKQEQYLREALKGIDSVYVFLDTDTLIAKPIAMSLTQNIRKLTKLNTFYVDITENSSGKYKDITDAIRDGKGTDYILELIGNAKVPKMPIMPTLRNDISTESNLDLSPFSAEMYNKLPLMLKELCTFIEKDYQKDIFLLASLPIIATHLDNVLVENRDGKYTPDLFTLVIANAASGKGFAYKAKGLGSVLNSKLQQVYLELKTNRSNPMSTSNRQMLFLPANSSDRAFYDHLQANKGKGIIFESEIDTLLKAFHQDWGNFSDIFRKAFHHEDLSINRKDDRYYIAHPSLSVFLSGTIDQYQRLFKNTENGFYSRWCIYTFNSVPEWISHKPTKESKLLEEKMKTSSNELYDLYLKLQERSEPLLISLSEEQWDLLDSTFEVMMKKYVNYGYSDTLVSSLKRSATIALRVVSILTMVRLANEDRKTIITSDVLIPQSEDLSIALELATTTLNHSSYLFNENLQFTRNNLDLDISRVLSCLPEQFKTNEAIEIAKQIGFNVRTLHRRLNYLVESGVLTKVKHGVYKQPVFNSSN